MGPLAAHSSALYPKTSPNPVTTRLAQALTELVGKQLHSSVLRLEKRERSETFAHRIRTWPVVSARRLRVG